MTAKQALARHELWLEGNWDASNGRELGGWISDFWPAGNPRFELIPMTGEREEIEALARKMVRATNVHDELVAALENILAFMKDKYAEHDNDDCDLAGTGTGALCRECESNGCIAYKIKMIRAALAKVEGDQPAAKENES